MLKSIKNKIQMAALVAPVYAETISIKTKGSSLSGLEQLSVSGIISGAISLVLIVVALVLFLHPRFWRSQMGYFWW